MTSAVNKTKGALAPAEGHLNNPAPTFRSVVRGELFFAFQRPVTWTIASIWLLQIVLFAYVIVAILSAPSEFISTERSAATLDKLTLENVHFYPFASIPVYGAPVFVVLGSIVGASDYTRGTVHVVLSRIMTHELFALSRIVALLAWGLVLSVLTLLAGIATSSIRAVFSGIDLDMPGVEKLGLAVLVGWLAISTYLLIGMTLGFLLRNTLASSAVGLIITLGLETLIVGTLSSTVSAIEGIRAFTPSGATSSLVVSLAPESDASTLMISAPSGVPLAFLVLLCWAIIVSAVSVISLRRRDVA